MPSPTACAPKPSSCPAKTNPNSTNTSRASQPPGFQRTMWKRTSSNKSRVNQWKLVRIDKSEAKIYAPGALPPGELALAIHRLYLTQARLERSISCTIADLQNYRKDRLARHAQDTPKPDEIFSGGLIWKSSAEDPGSYSVLPRVRGLDGVWREIPRELLADFPKPPAPGDKTAPPVNPKPNGSA